jgi:hypothetical protein
VNEKYLIIHKKYYVKILAAVYQKSRTITPLENFNAQNNISVEGNRGR